MIPFWEFYFLPLSVQAQTNIKEENTLENNMKVKKIYISWVMNVKIKLDVYLLDLAIG